MPRTRSPLRSEPTARNRGGGRRLGVPLVLAAAAILAAVGLRGRLPDLRSFVAAIAGTDYGWVALAAGLQAGSLAAFVWQQRQLLRALGVRLGTRRLTLVTLARTALSICLPAGAAVSAGYTIREYERAGASREVAAASTIVSGLASLGGLALLYVAGGAAVLSSDPGLPAGYRPLLVVAGLAAVTAAVVVAGRRISRPARSTPDPVARRTGRVARLLQAALDAAREAWRAGASLRTRDWAAAVLYAAVNWFADLLCLTASCRAVGLPVGVTTLAGIYLGVQIVRQVPLTPGGVGLVDTALVAGLTAAGATAVTAAAAVLVYRLLSCWLLVPAGGAAVLLLRRGAGGPQPLTLPASRPRTK